MVTKHIPIFIGNYSKLILYIDISYALKFYLANTVMQFLYKE